MSSQDNTQKNIIQFVACPVCGGSGKNKIKLGCSNCGGLGLGSFYEGQFFYWAPQLGTTVIELDRFRKKMEKIIKFFFYLIGIFGLFSLAFWIYLHWNNYQLIGWKALFFWRETHILLLVFWLSVVADMFLVFITVEEILKKQKIKPLPYEEKRKIKNIPSNWEELKSFKYKLDVSRAYSKEAFYIVEEAFIFARSLGHAKMEPIHLFYASLSSKQVAAIFTRLNVDVSRLVFLIKKQLQKIVEKGMLTKISKEAKEVLVEAYLEAYQLELKEVEVMNLLLPCMRKDKALAEILYELEVDENKINNVILWFIINKKLVEAYKEYRRLARFKPSSNMDRAYTAVATPILDHFSYDLTRAAKWGKLPFCVAREKEIEKIFESFESGQHGVILVGPPGVGKKTIIDGIAQLMVKEDVPKILKDKRLVELDAARLVSGANAAQAQERMLVAIDEAVRAGNIVLYIDNIENIIGITAGGEESLDLSEVLASALSRYNIFCLATATSQNYTKYIEGTPLGNTMAKISIDEPDDNKAIQIIESKIGAIEAKYKVYFSYNAIEQVLKLSKRYIHDKYLPSKAIEILNSIAVRTLKEKGENSMVTKDDIAQVISEITGIPVTKISEEEGRKLLNLEEKIHERMIDQEEAVKMVAASLRRARAQLREGKRPIANFLFLGPTGVGKTELAKTIAEVYFGNENYMIRLDMSEYQHPDSVKKMIGSADGTLGYLTEAVRKSPFSLVLLDELEKAHPDILNLFLQVMDDGRLTDGQGRTIDFTNSIIIATSNAGALYIQEQLRGHLDDVTSKEIEEIKQTLINDHLNKVMRPELINRFDGVIVFKPLSQKDVEAITRLMLNKIAQMLSDKGIRMQISDDGVKILARQGFDPKFGARPLRRLLQDKIENIIANKILAGELERRDTVIIDNEARVIVQKAPRL